MMRALFDTNVALDVLLKRSPWVDDAVILWRAVQDERLEGFLSASCLTDIFYIVRKIKDHATARKAVRLCFQTFEICDVGRWQIERADELEGDDFEDNLQLACAEAESLDAIITRDPSGLASGKFVILTPDQAVARIT